VGKPRYRSDGYYHERNALVVCGIATFAALLCILAKQPVLSTGLIFGVICGLFVDPDLDQRTTTRAENRMYRISKPLGALFHMYFIPYGLLPHRSVLTHGSYGLFGWVTMILVATPLRILYAFWWLVLLGILVEPSIGQWLLWIPPWFWVGMYTGWAAQDVVHWLRDGMFRKHRKRFRSNR